MLSEMIEALLTCLCPPCCHICNCGFDPTLEKGIDHFPLGMNKVCLNLSLSLNNSVDISDLAFLQRWCSDIAMSFRNSLTALGSPVIKS